MTALLVRLTDEAHNDIIHEHAYIAADNLTAADEFRDALLAFLRSKTDPATIAALPIPQWGPRYAKLTFTRKGARRTIVVEITDTHLIVHGIFGRQHIASQLSGRTDDDALRRD